MRMAQDMQMMNEKMEMTTNAMRGRVSTNLDGLVRWTNSPFIAKVTSFPPPNEILNAASRNV